MNGFTFTEAVRRLIRQVFSIDVRSLALMRFALAGILILDSFERIRNCRAFAEGLGINFIAVQQTQMSEDGLIPAISLLGMSPSLTVQYAVLLLRIGIALALLVGFRTTATTTLCFLFNQSVMLNNPYGLNGGDVLLNLLLLIAIFLPLGRAFSLDALRRTEHAENVIFNGASTAALLVVGMVYWTNMVAKCYVPAWHLDYTALEYSLRYSEVTRPLGDWLLSYPSLLKMLTRLGINLELYVPLLVFVPIALPKMRLVAVPVMIFFHAVAINFCMDIGWFGFVISAAWLMFIPTEVWQWLYQRFTFEGREEAPGFERAHAFYTNLAIWMHHVSPLGPEAGPFFRRWNQVGGSFCLLLVSGLLYLNLGSVVIGDVGQPLEKAIGYCIRNQFVNCSWAMFENPANFRQRWATVEITRVNGKTEVIDGTGLAAGKDFQGRVADLYPNERWRKVCERVRKDDKLEKSGLRNKLAAYVVREWCRTHAVSFSEIQKITLISNETTLADSRREKVTRRELTVEPFFLDKLAYGSRWSPISQPVEPVSLAQNQPRSEPRVPAVESAPLNELNDSNKPPVEALDSLSLQLVPN